MLYVKVHFIICLTIFKETLSLILDSLRIHSHERIKSHGF